MTPEVFSLYATLLHFQMRVPQSWVMMKMRPSFALLPSCENCGKAWASSLGQLMKFHLRPILWNTSDGHFMCRCWKLCIDKNVQQQMWAKTGIYLIKIALLWPINLKMTQQIELLNLHKLWFCVWLLSFDGSDILTICWLMTVWRMTWCFSMFAALHSICSPANIFALTDINNKHCETTS